MDLERRWLPTLLGCAIAGTVAIGYECGWRGDHDEARNCPPCACADEDRDRGRVSAPAHPLRHRAPSACDATPEELAALRERIALLEAQARLVAERSVTGELAYYGFGQAELDAMARHCDVRVDYPRALDAQGAEDLGLDASERAAWQRAIEAFAAEEHRAYRALLRELDPSRSDLDELSLAQTRRLLIQRVGDAMAPEDEQLRRHVALERAGQRPPPAALDELSIYARYHRLRLSAGDRFASLMAAELGPDRSAELREAFAGWPGARTRELGCPDDPTIRPAQRE